MSTIAWSSLRKAAESIDKIADTTVAQKVDLYLDATLETISDRLSVAPVKTLSEGSRLAKDVLDALSRSSDVDRLSTNYIAGRLAAASDVLGYAARQTADEALLPIARMQPYARILAALYERPMRNSDLVTLLHKDKGQISRNLTELRKHEAVTSHKNGRELYNALTPVGRLIVEAGIQEAHKAPLENASVHSFAAELPVKSPDSYSIRDRAPRKALTGSQIPMLHVSR
jgi:hypothetical protein